MMNKIFRNAPFCLLAFMFSLGELAAQEPYEMTAERRLESIDAPRMPGVSYAAVKEGEVTEVGATGVLRMGGSEKVTPDTPFVIGSISKSFTALAVMQLVEAGKFSLDDSIEGYLEEFEGRASGSITVRQLLSHTSGFSTYQGLHSIPQPAVPEDAIAMFSQAVAKLEPAYGPDQMFSYSNANYQVLGRLVEVVSGEQFPGYIETNILRPIGMSNSFVSDGRLASDMAIGHTPWFGSKRPLEAGPTDPAYGPQGGVVASANDMARYMAMMVNGRDDIVSASTKQAMMSPASDLATGYGLGWILNVEDGTVWHSGSTPGIETLLTLDPEQAAGVVVMVNAGSGVGFGDTAAIRDGITASILGRDYQGAPAFWGQKATFACLALMPLIYLICMVWAWRHRSAIRQKSGVHGMFSLWFPLLTTMIAAWALVYLVPRIMGVPLATMQVFLPDLAISMVAAAVGGVLWAVVRLAIFYTGDSTDPGVV